MIHILQWRQYDTRWICDCCDIQFGSELLEKIGFDTEDAIRNHNGYIEYETEGEEYVDEAKLVEEGSSAVDSEGEGSEFRSSAAHDAVEGGEAYDYVQDRPYAGSEDDAEDVGDIATREASRTIPGEHSHLADGPLPFGGDVEK